MIRLRNIEFSHPRSTFRLSFPLLEIARGEKVAIVGPSGCGKTTLLNLIAGILLPQSGIVELGGEAISKMKDAQRRRFRIARIGQVFQRFELVEYLNVRDNILFPVYINFLLRLDRATMQRAESVGEQLGLADKMLRFPAQLSQGEQQRVAIGRAMLLDPRWILADEPTGSLDHSNKLKMIDMLFEQSMKNNSTLIVVTHDTGILGGFDRIIDFAELCGAHSEAALTAL